MTSGPTIVSRWHISAWLLATIAIAAMTFDAIAQQPYPNRPIHLIVPYPPGALTDLLGRTIADRLGTTLKQPVIVENRPGAGTLVGAEYVAKQPADGYTLLMATSTTLGISPALYRPSPVNPLRDFAPISPVGTVSFFLIANPKFPAKNVKEMIDTIKAAPGQYNYASVGSGSPHHLFMEALKAEYGLDIQHVPYKGTPAALADLLTGNIHVMFCDATIAVPNIKAGKVVALGTSAAKPTTLVADIPPIATTVSGYDWQAWQGIVAPAGMPKEIVTKLAGELQKIQASADFKEQLVKFGMEPFPPQSAEQFAAMIATEQPRWEKAIKDSGAKVD
ncbi:MAG: tripartite tricarboxylate transporter substrate binding protein [Betaproteobacteria bacterium]|nr:MAG: tripartite tricarboxylate transporter substrate binding protein [Betaproteobacteria bacterium]